MDSIMLKKVCGQHIAEFSIQLTFSPFVLNDFKLCKNNARDSKKIKWQKHKIDYRIYFKKSDHLKMLQKTFQLNDFKQEAFEYF